MTRAHHAACLIVVGFVTLRPAYAGQPSAPREQSSAPAQSETVVALPPAFDGPPVPILPELITRDATSGKVTIRAVQLSTPLRIDGRLDEDVYETLTPISDFIQTEPQQGTPASERTDVWLLFDGDHVYVSIRCWESRPDRMVVNEMRRDAMQGFMQGEHVAFVFDTFLDRRNGVEFSVNPIGGRFDGQITNEGQFNSDWNPVWDYAVGRFEGGWTVEAAVPFKSIRYRPGRAQVWGINLRRVNRWKNEISHLTPIPNSMGLGGIMHMSLAATAVGIDAPPGSRNLEVKPYATSSLASNAVASPRVSNDLGADVGVDVKYGLTQNLTADFTYNTDFAQVEADEQQVNLTRFSLFFPEKREFFLENQGLFNFGGVSGNNAGDTPLLFYSRRIGLNRGRAVPIVGGGRLTGRVGRFNIGMLNIQSDDEDRTLASGAVASNFTVVRMKRDILRRSSIGALATARSVAQSGSGTNEVYGLDGTFAFFDNLSINTYWAQTRTSGVSGGDTSYRTQLDYKGDRYGVQLERLTVGAHFKPEIGYVQRGNMRRSYGQFRFSPRPRRFRTVRRFSSIGSFAYVEDSAGRLETRDFDGELAVEYQNGDRFSAGYANTYEFLPQPFQIASGVTLPVAGYEFASGRTSFTFGQQRMLSGTVTAERGSFYGGEKTAIGASRGRVRLTPQLSVEPSFSVNWVDLPQGTFRTTLVSSRVTYTVTPKMFASALLQYNSSLNAMTSNVRFRWEYLPGSELFLVFNEERDTLARHFPDMRNRTFIMKVNRLLRF